MIREDIAKQALQSKGMTQYDLAVETRQRESYINRILNRAVEPRVSLAILIAEALGVSVESLWEPGTFTETSLTAGQGNG